jgi:transporter family-2 protein
VGNAVFWCIGALGSIVIGLTGWNEGVLKPLAHVNPWLLTAGLLGTSLVFAIAWLIPQVGAGPVMITLLAGQIFGGMLLSNYGWLGSPVRPVSWVNILGALVMVGGVFIATYAPSAK